MAIKGFDKIKGHRYSDHTKYGQGLDYDIMFPKNSYQSNITDQTYEQRFWKAHFFPFESDNNN